MSANKSLLHSSPQHLRILNKPIKLLNNKSAEHPPTDKQTSNSFSRTTTLPRRFKEKFLNKYNASSTSSTIDSVASNISNPVLAPSTFSTMSVNSQSSSVSDSSSSSTSSSASELNKSPNNKKDPAKCTNLKKLHARQLQSLNKFVEKFVKSIKYLDQIILKKKYEIISSSITAILETVLDIYNVIQSFDTTTMGKNALKITNGTNLIMNSSTFKSCRSRINKSLASLIKWSDSILFLNSTSNNELFNESQLYDSARTLINQLNKAIKHLVKYLKKFFITQEMWWEQHIDANVCESGQTLADTQLDVSSSSSNSSLKIEKSQKPETKHTRISNVSMPASVNQLICESTPSFDYQQLASAPVETTTTKSVNENNGVEITHTTVKSTTLPSNTQITQTTTLTTTTSAGNANQNHLYNNNVIDPLFNIDQDLICNPVRLSAFIDLDRLVLELSSLGTSQPNVLPDNTENKSQPSTTRTTQEVLSQPNASFTNAQCNYLVTQFESFAKEFQKKEISSDVNSRASTVDITSPEITKTLPKKTTIFSNTVFKHNNEQKVSAIEGVQTKKKFDNNSTELSDSFRESSPAAQILNKLIDYKATSKTNFKETNIYLNDKSANEILNTALNSQASPVKTLHLLDKTTDPIQTFTSLFDDPDAALKETKEPPEAPQTFDTRLDDSVDEEVDDDGNINALIFGANKLNPNFLLIDDNDEENYDKCDNSEYNKNRRYKKNFLVDDDELNEYNDTIDLHELEAISPKKKTNNDSLLSTWSLSSTSSGSSACSSLSSFSNQMGTVNKVNVKEQSKSTISLNSQAFLLATNVHENDIKEAELRDYKALPDLEANHSTDIKPATAPLFFTPSNNSPQTTAQSLSSTSSSFSSLSGPNAASSKPASTNSPSSSETEKTDNYAILHLFDVSHLLEYQSNPTTTTNNTNLLTTSSVTGLNSQSQVNTNILRGGHVDALIVLATSAQTGVSGAHAYNAKANTTSVISSMFNSSSLTISAGNNKYITNGSQWQADSNSTKNNFLFQEAFLTTYRMIIEPVDLINKLIYRYRYFSKYSSSNAGNAGGGSGPVPQTTTTESLRKYVGFEKIDEKFDFNRIRISMKNNKMYLSAAKNSLALLVRVLDDLGNELNEKIVETFADFVYELLLDDELQLARLLRKKLINKLDMKRLQEQEKESKKIQKLSMDLSKKPNGSNLSSDSSIVKLPNPAHLSLYAKRSHNLLDFKSVDLAEQMTLIDLSLFLKIELPEVLLWSTKQNEEFSPNLILFTEHFNNISYWARSRILEHDSPKEREKYIIKFLKIMKHLKKMKNFNSYLSILSAVDSGPIQRLDWPKNITDSIKEFSVLIDPKCGFKTLREAVNEAQPPCIPHIGLILQDLTILHIANSDYLPSGNCNFWKRWQQFNILERLRFFRRCNYDFKPNAKIQQLFNNFEDFFNEDAQYALSEQLKPRSKHN